MGLLVVVVKAPSAFHNGMPLDRVVQSVPPAEQWARADALAAQSVEVEVPVIDTDSAQTSAATSRVLAAVSHSPEECSCCGLRAQALQAPLCDFGGLNQRG